MDLQAEDRFLSSLLEKHPGGEARWALILKEFNRLSSQKKSKDWIKRRCKKLETSGYGHEHLPGAQISNDLDVDGLADDASTAEVLRQEGNRLYLAEDNVGAIAKYKQAIDTFEKDKGYDSDGDGEELAVTDRKFLAVLYANRAQAGLSIIWGSLDRQASVDVSSLPIELRERAMRAHRDAGKDPSNFCAKSVDSELLWYFHPSADVSTLPKELRRYAMRAHLDAGKAVELDASNSKAWLRKGQAILWMSALGERAKEAVRSLEEAKRLGVAGSFKNELEQSLQYAKAIFDNETPMPDQCPQQ